MKSFGDWFRILTSHSPHGWQERLGIASTCQNRLIRVPTGLGKTAGVVAAWAYNRLVRRDDLWPRRLVFCLPMRVLVEQTEAEIRAWLAAIECLWDGEGSHDGKVGVHVLMGGVERADWHLYPEHCAVLVGTQDMLLSRALNRGYGCARGRWPMEFGQLHQDCLWILDEVQLMDVGLATSVQLEAFRLDDGSRQVRPVATWWMSATMQDAWFETCVDFKSRVSALARTAVDPVEQAGPLWAVQKSVEIGQVPKATDDGCSLWAKVVTDAHRGGVTIAVCNTVDSACQLFDAVGALLGSDSGTDLRLVHSRFRGLERAGWRDDFLRRGACTPDANRIIVATQVIEAGVDISADVLVSELAPWPSLVQRFGRCARYGGSGRIIIVDRMHCDTSAAALDLKKKETLEGRRRADDETTALPYALAEVVAARSAARAVRAADPATLEAFEASLDADARAGLYPYEPPHVLMRRELDDLFDTGPDLTGADIDISRFIRSGEERDVTVWWWSVGEKEPAADVQPTRALSCPVPVAKAREWLRPKTSENGEAGSRLRAWVWDYLADRWRPLADRDIYPGRVILVDVEAGGYDARLGFTGKKRGKKEPAVPVPATIAKPDAALRADLAEDHEDLSVAGFKTIATHGVEAAAVAGDLAHQLGLPSHEALLLDLAARAHDLGKAHPVFAAAIRDKGPHAERTDLAKAPDGNWFRGREIFTHDRASGSRRGFRHELASTLGLFELLWRIDPAHAALLGPHRALLDAIGQSPILPAEGERVTAPSGFGSALRALDADGFDLVAWLVCSHHGKVRATWQATPRDQEFDVRDGRGPPLRGVREGDALPATALANADGSNDMLPPLALHLDPAALGLSLRYGASWGERTARLRRRLGPFRLAYLETLLRVADVRASQLATIDPLLVGGGGS